MIGSTKITISALHCKDFMIRLDELGVPYKERRGMLDSVIVIKVYTAQQEAAYDVWAQEFTAFERNLTETARQEARAELARKNQCLRIDTLDWCEKREESVRKNRFCRLTFRKPLVCL